MDLFTDFGRKLSSVLQPANDAAVGALNAGADAIGTTFARGRENPSPSQQLGNMVMDQAGDLVQSNVENWSNVAAKATGDRIGHRMTPEEQQAATERSLRIIENNPFAPGVYSAVPEVIGMASTSREALDRLAAQKRAGGLIPSPSAGIVSRAQADEAAPAMDRYYHGTASDFARPDAGKFDPNGLFGPGYYITDNPKVAGGVVDDAGERVRRNSYTQNNGYAFDRHGGVYERESYDLGIQEQLAIINDPRQPEEMKDFARKSIELMERDKAKWQPVGPNIRPVDVPRDLRLLDADAPVTPELRQAAMKLADQVKLADPMGFTASDLRGVAGNEAADGQQLWETVARGVFNLGERGPDGKLLYPDKRTAANAWLARNGYDGIRYAGGKRIPMMDETGNAIEHNAVVIFPESLDKIRNATAGTPGGFLPSGARDTASGANEFTGAAARAVGAGVGAGYQESQREGSTPESVLAHGIGGAVTSGGNSLAGKLIGRKGVTLLSRAVQQNAPQNAPKTPAEAWDAVTETIKPESASPLREKVTDFAKKLQPTVAKNWFDATKPLRDITQDAEKALGRKLLPHENAWLQARLLPGTGRAVEEQITQTLGPAVKGLDDVALERLNGYAAALDAVDKGKATGNMGRKFGQFTGTEAQLALDHLRTTLSPFEMADLDKRMGMVRTHVDQLRDRMVDSGLISKESADLFKQKYPNYSPIQFLDWLDDAERRVGQSASLSVSENGIKNLTPEGASYQRKAPLEALLDATFATERRAARNEAAQAFANYTKIDPTFKDLMRPANEAAVNYLGAGGIARKAPNETTFSMWENGVKHDFYMDKSLADAIRQDRWQMGGPAGTAIQAASAAFRAGATGSNVLFLIPNATGDALTAMVRGESAGSLLRGYKEAFTHGPEYKAFLEAGGGYSGMIESGTSRQSIDRLRGSISKADQLKAYASWVNPLKIAQELGERVEMAPRVGMFGQALREGASTPEAALAGRDITMDFARAGLWARAINQVVPFFNVGLQAPAQVARLFAKTAPGEVARPGTSQALARVAGLVVAPTIALEAYNRQDPTYKDVPQYDKDRALIIMDPRGPGEVDPDTGRPTPRYALIGLREWTPFAIATREAIGRSIGDEDRDWRKVADAVLRNSSPVSLQEGVSAVLPPWITVPFEMQTNYDTFRDRAIIPESVQDRLPEEQYTSTTSETSKLIGRAIQKPPAMIEHAIRGAGTGVAGQALAASDMALRAVGAAPPAEDRGRVRDTPVVGGLASRFYREQGGEITNRQREQNAAQFETIMRGAGLKGDEVQPVGWTIGDTKLTSAEQSRYQTLFNGYFDEMLSLAKDHPNWDDAINRPELARKAASQARKLAGQEVLSDIDPGDRLERKAS